MTITLNLDPQTEAYLQEQAARHNQPVADYLERKLRTDTLLATTGPLSDEDFEFLSDELADAVGPDVPNWSNEDISREVIYGDRH